MPQENLGHEFKVDDETNHMEKWPNVKRKAW